MAARKAATIWAQEGPRAAVAWLGANLLRPQRFVVMARELSLAWPDERPAPGVEVRVGGTAALPPAERDALPSEFFFDRIYGLSTGVFAFARGRLARVDWLALPGEFNRFIDLRPDEAESFQTYVLPPYRSPVVGRALARAATFTRLQWLRDQGYASELARVAGGNVSLQRVLQAYGYRRIGSVTQVALYSPRFRTAR